MDTGRGCSSVGRAPALQAGGQGFESPHLHWRESAARTLKTAYREKDIKYPMPGGQRCSSSKRNHFKERVSKDPGRPGKGASRNAMRGVQEKSSKKEHRADALALRADERRDKLRKAMGRSKYPMIHGCLNGATRLRRAQSPYSEYIGIRREPPELKHLSRERKRKKDRFPK